MHNPTHPGQVVREAMLQAGEALGLNLGISECELDRMKSELPHAFAAMRGEIEAQNLAYPSPIKRFLGGELRLSLAIEKIVTPVTVGAGVGVAIAVGGGDFLPSVTEFEDPTLQHTSQLLLFME